MDIIDVDVLCLVYKGYHYLNPLVESFKKQKNVKINNIIFAITDSEDEEMNQIRDFVKVNNIKSFEVKKKDFSHSLTRQKALLEYCTSKIVVMLSQDVKLVNEDAFYNLVKDIHLKDTVYNYGRQICKKNSIEKYIRRKNYSKDSKIVSKEDIDKLQLMAFFASDAFSAYDRDIFVELGGYGEYDLMMNEDQLYSYNILMNGYKKKYCADAIVEHSHKYKLKQLYKRYYDAGVFYSKVKVFDNYKSTDSGMKLAFYVLGQALLHFDIPVLFRWLPDMAARYLGMKKGKKEGKR